jgi:pSer/pThr/pTyr-binding forkhead associated (FHA) protein
MPKISVTFPSGERVTHELAEETITVGRLSDNDLVIDDPSISSHHAELVHKDGDYVLKDLQSTNGTKVNGEKGTQWDLQDGDVIIFGKVASAYASEIPSSKHSLPETEERTVELSNESHRPADFTNASRFKSKSKKKAGASVGIVAFAVLSMVVFVVSVILILMIQPPV